MVKSGDKSVHSEHAFLDALKNAVPSLQDTDISPAQRDEAVRWLTDVHRCLKLYPETLCLAISILDRFLSTIKVHGLLTL